MSLQDHSIKVHNLSHISPSLARILNHTHVLHTFITYLFTILFNIITGSVQILARAADFPLLQNLQTESGNQHNLLLNR